MPAAPGHQQFLAILGDVTNQLFGVHVVHHRAHRQQHPAIGTGGAGHVAAGAILAAFGFISAYMAKVGQGVEIIVADQKNTATVTAVTPIGAAFLDELYAQKMHNAVRSVFAADAVVRQYEAVYRSALREYVPAAAAAHRSAG